MSNSRHQTGFTLIEIIVVIVIIAIAVTGVALGLGNTKKAKLRSSCWMLISASRYAYSRAVTQGTTVRLVLDFENRTLQIQETTGRVVLNREDETGSGLKREGDDVEVSEDGSLEAVSLSGKMSDIGPDFGGGSSISGGSTGNLMADMVAGMSQGPISDPFLASLQSGMELGELSGKANRYRGPRFEEIEGKRGKKRQLAGVSNFYQVFSPHAPSVIEEGTAFIYYFPGGTTEHTYIQMTDGDEDEPRIYTVEIHPINGRAFVHHDAVEPEGDLDDYQEVE